MTKEIIKEAKDHFEKSISFLQNELSQIRTGRAQPGMVENIKVMAYGVETPLMQLATISTPEPQQILIDPFDKSILKDIEKAITFSSLNLNPQDDGEKIRIQVPPLTEETRTQIVKDMHGKLEEARIALRNSREDALKKVKKAEADKTITEDDKRSAEEELNKLISGYNDKVKEMGEKKETELMKV